MSQLNPYMHLNQALIRPQQMAGMMQPQLDPTNPAMRLQAANALGAARRGSAGMMPGGYSSGPSGDPMAQNIMKAKSLVLNSEMNGDEEIPDELKKLRDDPSVPMQTFEHLVKTYAANKAASQGPKQHNFGGEQAPPPMVIPKGQFAGQSLNQGDILMKGPQGTMRENAPAPQQQAQDPIVQMHDSLKSAGVPEQALAQWRALAQSGATPQQLYAAGQHLVSQNQQAGPDTKEQRTEQHQQFTEHKAVLDELQKKQKAMEEEDPGLLRGHARNPDMLKEYQEVLKEQGDVGLRMKQMITPGQGQQQPAPQQKQGGKQIDPNTAHQFYMQAGGDPNKARQLAKAAGFNF